MLILKNIKINNGCIEANYAPENSSETGYIKINSQTKSLIESEKTSFDDPLPSYFSHAVKVLIKLIDEEQLPEEKVVMWF